MKIGVQVSDKERRIVVASGTWNEKIKREVRLLTNSGVTELLA